MRRSGARCIQSGRAYETVVANRLSRMAWQNLNPEDHPIPLEVCEQTAGSGHGNDVSFAYRGRVIGVEVKTKGAMEAGQRAMSLVRTEQGDHRLILPDIPENAVHRRVLPTNFVPFEGRIPSFKLADKSLETWGKEKPLFKSHYMRLPQSTAIAEYYAQKGSSYIQLQGHGLYHTGEDPCNFGVPMLCCSLRVRVRCKQHGSSPVPGSVQVSLNLIKGTIPSTPYCLEDPQRLPHLLCEIAVSDTEQAAAADAAVESESESEVTSPLRPLQSQMPVDK